MLVMTAAANPPAPGDQPDARPPVESSGARGRQATRPAQPAGLLAHPERQRLLEAGQTAEAAALAQTGTDRVLVILVEFAGTDTLHLDRRCRQVGPARQGRSQRSRLRCRRQRRGRRLLEDHHPDEDLHLHRPAAQPDSRAHSPQLTAPASRSGLRTSATTGSTPSCSATA